MTQRRGADWRVSIDDNFIGCSRIEVSSRSQAINTSNTEGVPGNPESPDLSPGFVTKIPDLSEGQFRIVLPTFDDDLNPYAAPFSFNDGQYYHVVGFPAGSGVKFDFGSALCTAINHTANIPGAQPVDITFESDGSYTIASS